MDRDQAANKLLDTAEALFYERGIQAVGMAELRTASGVSLKRFYQCFASKDELVEAYLRRRDARWLAALAAHVERSSEQPVLAVFDWLHEWFREPGFRGCAFLNSFGELGGVAPSVADAARDHKEALHDYLRELAGQLDVADPGELSEQLLILIDGAIATAAVKGRADAAYAARSAAAALLATRAKR